MKKKDLGIRKNICTESELQSLKEAKFLLSLMQGKDDVSF